MKKKLISSLALLLTAVIWGFAFSAQSIAIDRVGVFSLQAARSFVGVAFLSIVILIFCKKEIITDPFKEVNIKGGIVCGIVLFFAVNVQQYGIKYTTVANSSFISTLYIFMVPMMLLLVGKKPSKKIWICVVISLLGMYLLCNSGNLELNLGDWLTVLSAFLFSLHIFVIDKYAPRGDGIVISAIQFAVTGVLSLICMLIFDDTTFADLLDAWIPILYAGVGSCGIAYTLQILYQPNLNPSAASLILCLESVFGALGGWLILGEELTGLQILGCGLMFIAIVIANVDKDTLAL